MKTLLLLLSCLLFTFSPKTFIPAANAAFEKVRDTDDEKLQGGTKYYILPYEFNAGDDGGVSLAYMGNESCPPGIAQAYYVDDRGIAVTFWPLNSNKGVIRQSTDLNIQFSFVSKCQKSRVWTLENYYQPSDKYYVTTRGVSGNPGSKTLNNWFTIGEYYEGYKIFFCPSSAVCSSCNPICRDVSIVVEDNIRCLVVLNNSTPYRPTPFKVVFLKA